MKEAVFPFNKFPGVDPILGPEMKSTGEVMGVGDTFSEAYAKAQLAVKMQLPQNGTAILSVRNRDKPRVAELARLLQKIGFDVIATRGTAEALSKAGIEVPVVNKVKEGRPHLVDKIVNGEIALVVNTTEGRQAIADSFTIRRSALTNKVLYTTTMPCAIAVAQAIDFGPEKSVRRLQDLHEG